MGSRKPWLEATEEDRAGWVGVAMGREALPWDSLVTVRAKSACEDEMLGALFLQEENPEAPGLDIVRIGRRGVKGQSQRVTEA